MTKKAIDWESWVDRRSGTLFYWHPDDAPPGGSDILLTNEQAEEIRNRAEQERREAKRREKE